MEKLKAGKSQEEVVMRNGAGEVGSSQVMKDLTSCGLGKPLEDFKQSF